jgi:hypothetical protein
MAQDEIMARIALFKMNIAYNVLFKMHIPNVQKLIFEFIPGRSIHELENLNYWIREKNWFVIKHMHELAFWSSGQDNYGRLIRKLNVDFSFVDAYADFKCRKVIIERLTEFVVLDVDMFKIIPHNYQSEKMCVSAIDQCSEAYKRVKIYTPLCNELVEKEKSFHAMVLRCDDGECNNGGYDDGYEHVEYYDDKSDDYLFHNNDCSDDDDDDGYDGGYDGGYGYCDGYDDNY